jgi:hypothetical protein
MLWAGVVGVVDWDAVPDWLDGRGVLTAIRRPGEGFAGHVSELAISGDELAASLNVRPMRRIGRMRRVSSGRAGEVLDTGGERSRRSRGI